MRIRAADILSIKVFKIISIVGPVVLVALFEWVENTAFGERKPMIIWNIVEVIVLLVGAFSLSTYIFGIIERTQKESLRRNRELAALNSVASAVNESLNLDVVLYRALDEVLRVTDAEAGEIFLVDEQNQVLVRRAHTGLLPEEFQATTKLDMGHGFAGTVAKTGEAIVVQDLSLETEKYKDMFKKGGFRSLISIPLKNDNANIGAFNIMSPNPGRFTAEATRLLTTMGHQIAAGIDNARLHERVQSMSALEERERLAREMHDGLAQVLSYVVIKSQAAKEFVASGDTAQAKAELAELENIAREVYADVREVILGLRSTALLHGGMVSTLREFVFRFGQMSGIKTELDIPDDKLPALPTDSELQVIRVIQEALSNVRKHAGASHAWVRVSAADDQVKIIIEDDGSGFDVSTMRRGYGPHFGLQTMRERAASARGSLDIQSAAGHGTKVILTVPTTQGARNESAISR